MTSSVTCDYANAAWEVNAIGQNACQVYAALQGVCNPNFSIASVGASSPPYLPQDNSCGCNVVAYNLMAGCGWCQSEILTTWWLTESQWAGNCTATAFNATGIPPSVVTTNIAIPYWAFILPSGTTWSPSQAQLAAASASPSNTIATVFPSITSTPIFSASDTLSASSSRSTSTYYYDPGYGDLYGNGAKDAGKAVGIALGVILGIYALAAAAMIAVFFIRQNQRRAWYRPMGQYYASLRAGGQPLGYTAANNGGVPYETAKTPQSTTSGSQPYNYQPPPPMTPNPADYNAGYGFNGQPNPNPAYGGVPAGAGNTASMYGAQGNNPTSGPAGYRGYAEAH